jgi:large subunit ribosomal protein L29
VKASKLRDLSSNELVDRVAELKSELFNLRFQQATGQLQNPIKLNQCRKDIARVKTIIRERELDLKRA